MAKRRTWDFSVQVTAACSSDSSRAVTCTYSSADLLHFAFFRNMPLPDDPDSPLIVDLIKEGLSPWPVDAVALQLLVRLCQPFGTKRLADQEAPLKLEGVGDLEGVATNLPLLPSCADALGLSAGALEGLDGVVASMLRGSSGLFVVGSSRMEQVTLIQMDHVWEEHYQGIMALRKCPSSDRVSYKVCRENGSIVVMLVVSEQALPMARWCAEQLCALLERTHMPQSLDVLCGRMINQGRALLYNDDVWQARVVRLIAGSDSKPCTAAGALAKAAVAVGGVPHCSEGEHLWACSLQEVFCSGEGGVAVHDQWRLKPSYGEGAAGAKLEFVG